MIKLNLKFFVAKHTRNQNKQNKMSFTSEELKEIETFIVNLLHDEVGPIIKSEAGTTFQQYVDKANAVDLVTKYDKQIEQTIKERIHVKYGDNFKFIGE